jgi:hypothetical protein
MPPNTPMNHPGNMAPTEQQAKKTMQSFFGYPISTSGLAASGSATIPFSIQSDSHFRLQKLTYFADISQAAQTASSRVVPLVTIQITDSSSGHDLFSSPIPIPALFGNGELPFILPTPKMLLSRSTITVALANYSSGSTYDIYLGFLGAKIYSNVPVN